MDTIFPPRLRLLRPRPARAAVKATCEEEEENDWSEDGWLLTSDDDLFNKNYSWALLWKDDPDRRVCCGSSCLSPYISSHQLFSIFFEWPQRYTLRFDLNVYQVNWKKIIIMGITTTTTTTTIVLVYSYYNYIPQFVFCSIIITKILLKIIPSPPQRPRFFSHHVRVQVQGPLFVIYISRWKIIEYFIFSFAGPIRAFTT